MTEKIFAWFRSKNFSYESVAWAGVFVWVVLIYSTLYIVRPICEFLKDNTPFAFLINALLLLIMAGLAYLFYKHIDLKDKKAVALFLIVISIYLMAMLRMKIAEEKIHLIEYGLLAFLLHRAVAFRLKGWQAYLASFIIAALIGWGDEGIQYLLPNRYYQFRDVLLNWFGAGMGLALVKNFKKNEKNGDQPHFISTWN